MSSSNQKQLFEDLHSNYQDHYFDAYSNLYRDELIYNKIAPHIIKAKRVLEVGCGGGHNFLDFVKLGMSANTYHAIDISSKAATEFNERTKQHPEARAEAVDFTKPFTAPEHKYDLILFIGVLHHMTKDFETVFANINRNLAPSGVVVFFEPNAHFLNSLRQLWYRYSNNFDHENERALFPSELVDWSATIGLRLIHSNFLGAVGYFIIFNSMIIQTPKFLKRILVRPLIFLDKICGKLNSRYTLAAMIHVYERSAR